MTIAFTGSRPRTLWGYDVDADRKAVDRLHRILEDLYREDPDSCSAFVSGGAQGADQIAFKAVELLKADHPGITNRIIIPFHGQESGWTEHGLYSKEEYRLLLDSADRVDVAAGSPSRDAYMRRNRMLVDSADAVIAIALSSPIGAATGTGSTVRYAMIRGGRRVYWWDGSSDSLKRL